MSFTSEEQPKTVEWYTPKSIFDMMGLTFMLDPCHPGQGIVNWVPTVFVYTKEDDGLTKEWCGRVWLNPPYGRETPVWLAKMHEHRDGIALLFARTDTSWFHSYCAKADGILFLSKRVSFVNAEGVQGDSPNCGSMLVAWGDLNAMSLRDAAAGGHGVFWKL